jgi:transposase
MKKSTRKVTPRPTNRKAPEERFKVLNEIEHGRMTQSEAATILEVSSRQMRRIISDYREGGFDGLRNKAIGQPSHNKYDPAFKELVLSLTKEKYPDAGPTFLSELLLERHNLIVSRETLRHWLHDEGIKKIKEQKPRHRRKRDRKASFGTMLQMDTCNP